MAKTEEKENKLTSKETRLAEVAPKAGGKTPQIIDGVDKIIYARLLEDADSKDGQRIYFQTDAKMTEKSKTDNVTTKDGDVVTGKGIEAELSCSSYVTRFSEQFEWIKNAFHDHKKFELWIIDLSWKDDSDQKFHAEYFRAIIEEFQDSMAAEDKEKLEVKFKIEGKPKFGHTALPEELEAVTSDYGFVEAVHTPQD